MGRASFGPAGWLGAALVLGCAAGGCAPLMELPRPPAIAAPTAPELPAPALPPEAAPVAVPDALSDAGPEEPAPLAMLGPSDGPVTRDEETVAAFEEAEAATWRELAADLGAAVKPEKDKKRRSRDKDDQED